MRPAVRLSCAVLFTALLSCPVSAMSFHDFGRMNDEDDATYVSMLVAGAAKNLREHGHPDQAARAISLFKDTSKKGGVAQFASNLKQLNTLNSQNATNPNNRAAPFEIEDALARTLKDSGVNISAAELKAIGHGFEPIGPPRQVVPRSPLPGDIQP